MDGACDQHFMLLQPQLCKIRPKTNQSPEPETIDQLELNNLIKYAQILSSTNPKRYQRP